MTENQSPRIPASMVVMTGLFGFVNIMAIYYWARLSTYSQITLPFLDCLAIVLLVKWWKFHQGPTDQV